MDLQALSQINVDVIFSDPLLLCGVILLILGPIVFFYALFKYMALRRKEREDFAMAFEEDAAGTIEPPTPSSVPPPGSEDKTVQFPTIPQKSAPSEKELNTVSDDPLIEVHAKIAQLEEAISKIKNELNPNINIQALKEPPMNVDDFSKKFMTLAQHVIILEREVARLKKGKGNGVGPAPVTGKPEPQPSPPKSKPPIMPL